jgi:hypothetical protein
MSADAQAITEAIKALTQLLGGVLMGIAVLLFVMAMALLIKK